MGIFDRLRKRKSTAPAEGAGPEGHISETPLGYKQNYTEVCRYIWKNYVPEEGQADKDRKSVV